MFKNKKSTVIAGVALAGVLAASSIGVYATKTINTDSTASNESQIVQTVYQQSGSSQTGSGSGNTQQEQGTQNQESGQSGNWFQGGFGGKMGGMNSQMSSSTGNASEPSEIVTSTLTSNSAEALQADYANAETIVMSESNSSVKITSAGTYIITGTCTDGNIAVKKGTTGVVLILKDLDLTSTTGATVSLNKGTEVKVLIEGTVTLTDAEDIANEDSDDFDGAALKAKAGSSVVIGGSGTLNVNGSCKNGIKVSDLDDDDKAAGYTEASLIVDGDLTINITAAGDGMNSGTDLTIKSGTINVSAGDDGIKADYILTIGEEGEEGPTINVSNSVEGLEGATINIYSGDITVNASDDGINAANGDLTGYTYSLNIMGGTINVSSGADGIDSNGNVNIIGGLTTIVKSASNGGEGGLDYEGTCYIADGCLVNPYGTTMDSGNGGMGGFNGNFNGGGMNGGKMNGMKPGMSQNEQNNGTVPEMPEMPQNGEMPEIPQDGQMPEMPENGQMPQMMQDGQMPEMPENGQMPQMPENGGFGGPRGQKGQNGQNGFGPRGNMNGQNGRMPWGGQNNSDQNTAPQLPGLGEGQTF